MEIAGTRSSDPEAAPFVTRRYPGAPRTGDEDASRASDVAGLSGFQDSKRYSLTGTTTLVLMLACLLLVLHWSFSRSEFLEKTAATQPEAWRPPPGVNLTKEVLEELMKNGSTECHRHHTRSTGIFLRGKNGMQAITEPLIRLEADKLNLLELVSLTEDGVPRCSGGDYYEVDLVSPSWHSRPPTRDLGDGSYRVSLQVSSQFAQQHTFNLSIFLLFDAFHGLDHDCQAWELKLRAVFLQIVFFVQPGNSDPVFGPVALCGSGDLGKTEWAGRWTREWMNNSCLPDQAGRFRECLPPEHQYCSNGWCQGRVSKLDSNGWVYSAHCSFRIFDAQEAWDCLSGRWLLFWGDSNFQDTIRNLLLFVLDYPVPYWSSLPAWQIPRSYEAFFVNPAKPDQALHISLIFNGHFQSDQGGLGLDSLLNAEYRESITRHFQGKVIPDVVIINSGLHDGEHFPTVQSFAEGAGRAAEFWKSLWAGLAPGMRPQMVYKTTIAPAGESRGMQSNPHKMQVFNNVIVERLRAEMPGAFKVVDAFDLSFPWHYDNNYSDGGHYGRAPKVDKWPWFGQPHEYFVDVMLAQILVNTICQK